jgi:hypothetical protein
LLFNLFLINSLSPIGGKGKTHFSWTKCMLDNSIRILDYVVSSLMIC